MNGVKYHLPIRVTFTEGAELGLQAHSDVLNETDVISWVEYLPDSKRKRQADGSFLIEMTRRDESNRMKRIVIRYSEYETPIKFTNKTVLDRERRVFVVHVDTG